MAGQYGRGQGLYRYKSATLLEKPSRLPYLLQNTRKMKLPERGTENCVHLLRAFNKEGVEYLLFGSMARSHYRSLASVGDMDVLINPTLENATKVKSALDEVVCRIYGSTPRCIVEDLAEPGKHLCLVLLCYKRPILC